jgi:hypothetical protein
MLLAKVEEKLGPMINFKKPNNLSGSFLHRNTTLIDRSCEL